MPNATFLPIDTSSSALLDFQLCKNRSGLQTELTVAKLTERDFRTISFIEAFDVIEVSSFGKIMVELWGTASDNNTPVIDLYGWSELSGHHIGQITATMGNFQTGSGSRGGRLSDGAHQSIRDAFDVSTAYRGADLYVNDTDFGATDAIKVSTQDGDKPGFFTVDFIDTQYKWFGIAVTNLGSATNIGAIFRPLSMKKNGVSPQLTA